MLFFIFVLKQIYNCYISVGWPRPRLTWYHENTVLDSTYDLIGNENRRGYRKPQLPRNRSDTITVNYLLLTNLTRWHPTMDQLQRTAGTSRLTCQASNSIATAMSGAFSHPSGFVGNGNLPPPATTEHVFIRLNRKCFYGR